MSTMIQAVLGQIDSYIGSRSFGLIRYNDKKYYFELSDVADYDEFGAPFEGQTVYFLPSESDQGLVASQIRRSPLITGDDKFELAPGFHIFNPYDSSEYVLIKKSDYCIRAKAAGRQKTVEKFLVDFVRNNGANAALGAIQYERKESYSGNFQYAVHILTCRPCLIGIRSEDGVEIDQLPQLDEVFKQKEQELRKHRKQRRFVKGIRALLALIVLLVVGDMATGGSLREILFKFYETDWTISLLIWLTLLLIFALTVAYFSTTPDADPEVEIVYLPDEAVKPTD